MVKEVRQADVNNITVPVKGNYILRIQYKDTEDGNATKVVTQQLRADFTVSVVNGMIRFDQMEDVTFNKVYLFYVGDSEINDVQNWTELVEVGSKYKYISGVSVNGSKGVRTYSGDAMYSVEPPINGNYVVRVEYYIDGVVDDNGNPIKQLLSKRFTLEKGPVVEVEDGKFSIDTRGVYSIDQMTVFYIGDKAVANPTWDNCVRAAANIEGSPYGATGYTALMGMDAITAAEITTPGNYLLRVNFKRDGVSYMMIVELTV